MKFPWIRILIVAVVAGVLVTACKGRDKQLRQEEAKRVTAHYELQIKQLRLDHQEALRVEHERVRAAEMRLVRALRNQEETDAFNKTQVADLQRRLDAAVTAGSGRLRDPNGCGATRREPAGAAAPAAEHRDADGAETAGLLSAQLTGLLRRLAREADEVNAAYASCRADLLRKSGGLD